jgi:hypothetical protein
MITEKPFPNKMQNGCLQAARLSEARVLSARMNCSAAAIAYAAKTTNLQ